MYKWILLFLSFSAEGSYRRSSIPIQGYFDLGNLQKEAIFIQGDAHNCSGSLLNPWTVLTAGHCITSEDNGVAKLQSSFKVGYGPDRDAPLGSRSSTKAYIHPEYQPSVNNRGLKRDLGLIILDAPIYEGRSFAVLSQSNPNIGDVVTGYGYGNLGDDLNGITNKNNSKLTGFQSIINYIFTSIKEGVLELRFPTAGEVNFPGATASGDSGGGVKNTRGELIAVISAGEVVPDNKASTWDRVEDLRYPSNLRFIEDYTPQYKVLAFKGGNISNPSNWSSNTVPKNTKGWGAKETHYDTSMMNNGESVVVDEDLNIDSFKINHDSSKFEVISGVNTFLDGGLYLRKGKAIVDGGLRGSFLEVGGEYHSKKEINLIGNGQINLIDGEIKTPNFNMRNKGILSGTGVITTNLFYQVGGTISPGIGNEVGTLEIKGSYGQDHKGDGNYIGINFKSSNGFGESSKLLVESVSGTYVLHFLAKFPDRFLHSQKYVIFESKSPMSKYITARVLYFHDWVFSSNEKWDDYTVYLDHPTLSVPSTPTSGVIPQKVYSAFSKVYERQNSASKPLFEAFSKVRDDDVFVESLSSFAFKDFHESISNSLNKTFSFDEYRFERVSLFLQKERYRSDFKSLTISGISGSSYTEDSPLSFYMSGSLPRAETQNKTENMIAGFDYALGKNLLGVNISFKNKPENWRMEESMFALNVYGAKKGLSSFYDWNLTGLYFGSDGSLDNPYGLSSTSLAAGSFNLQSRAGIYEQSDGFFGIFYGGMEGIFRKRANSKITQDNGLEITSSFGGEAIFRGRLGMEAKKLIKSYWGSVEPSFEVAAIFPLWGNDLRVQHQLYDVLDATFDFDLPFQRKPFVLGSFNLRFFLLPGMALNLELQTEIEERRSSQKALCSFEFAL